MTDTSAAAAAPEDFSSIVDSSWIDTLEAIDPKVSPKMSKIKSLSHQHSNDSLTSTLDPPIIVTYYSQNKAFLLGFLNQHVRSDGRTFEAVRPTTIVKGVLKRNTAG
jgi:polyribonucleotide nucleotidyltransferase